MEYTVVAVEDVPITDLPKSDEMSPDLDIRDVDEALECRNVAVNIWYFEEGEETGYHAHSEQEERFYALEGTFSLKLGRSGASSTSRPTRRPKTGSSTHRYPGTPVMPLSLCDRAALRGRQRPTAADPVISGSSSRPLVR